MSAPPYMKLFWGDYHRATRHLTTAQHGAYFLLIGEAWHRKGVLPNDDSLLALWALCTTEEWDVMKGTILAFFTFRRGKWVHKRVREELASYESISRKRKAAGKAGGSVTNGKDKETPQANANHLPTKPKPESKRKKEDLGGGETRSRACDLEGRTAALVASLTTFPQTPRPTETPAQMAARLRKLA